MEQGKKKTLSARHLFQAIQDDAELNNFFGAGLVQGGGVKVTVTDRVYRTQANIRKAEKKASRKAAKEQQEAMATMGA